MGLVQFIFDALSINFLIFEKTKFSIMAVLIIFILLSLILFHVWTRYGRIGRIVNKIPGMPAPPIIGNTLTLRGDKEQLWNILRSITQDYSITRVWLPTRVWILIREPEDIKSVLSSKVNVNKRSVYEKTRPWMRTGLLISDRELWSERRKIAKFGFFSNVMKNYVEIQDQCAKRFVEKLKLGDDESDINVLPVFSELTLEIVCETMFGISFAKLDKKRVQQYLKAIYDIHDIIIYRTTRPYLTDWMLRFLPLGRKQDRVIKIIHDFVDSIIRERKKYHANHQVHDTFNENHKGEVMLDALLSAERDGLIDADGVVDEVNIFTAAAYETTTITMAFTLMLLAENSEIQNRAREEVINIFNENGGKLNMTDVVKLEYLDRCLKEALRLYPSISQFLRYVDEDIQLNKYLIPAGVDVLILVYDLHRDPKLWPEPEKFDPDRFLPENVINRHPYAYIPFSSGVRNCIGQKFAMFKMKVILAHILYSFYLEPVDLAANAKLKSNIILQVSDPVHVKFIKRNEN